MSESFQIGGAFEFDVLPSQSIRPWPAHSEWFARGRDAARLVLESHRSKNARFRFFVPQFFCEDVVAAWISAGFDVVYFESSPLQDAMPDFGNAPPTETDIVLVVNYFGVSSRQTWAEYIGASFGAKVLEDHTHDPISGWSINSSADYCFASLRKTLPVPEGAILWGKGRSELVQRAKAQAVDDTKQIAAMLIKHWFLFDGAGNEQLKRKFRSLQSSYESELEACADLLDIGHWSKALLAAGFPSSWRERRERNVSYLAENLRSIRGFQLLFDAWPDSQVPYCIVLKFQCKKDRDDMRQRLIDAGIYPPVHWQIKNEEFGEAAYLGERVLSIPSDQRYGIDEMKYIVAVLAN